MADDWHLTEHALPAHRSQVSIRPPLVSVGLPVYNGSSFVRDAINSVLAQDICDLELVISDNGSTDDTEAICREIAAADGRVRYHRESVNRGAAWNYNNVLCLASGTYFHWAAADDTFEPGYLSACVEALQAHPDVSLAFTSTAVIDGNGRMLQLWQPRPGYATSTSAARRFRDVLWYAVMCFEVFGVTRRAVLLETLGIGPFTGSDRPLLAELALRGKFHHVPEPLFRNRVHAMDSMHTHPAPRQRATWFDPTSRLRFPHWRLLRAFVTAASRPPLPVSERLRTLWVIPSWMIREKGSLVDDLIGVVPGAIGRGLRRLRVLASR